jgi:hypothetical protein
MLLVGPPNGRITTTYNQRVRTRNLKQHNYDFLLSWEIQM